MPPMMPPTVPLSLRLGQMSFAELKGWAANDPKAALEAFRRSCVALSTRPDDCPVGRRQLCRHRRRLAPALPCRVRHPGRRRTNRAHVLRGRVRSLSRHPILGRRSLHRLLRAAIEGQPDQARSLSDAALWNPGRPRECRSRAVPRHAQGSAHRGTGRERPPRPLSRARRHRKQRTAAGQAAALCGRPDRRLLSPDPGLGPRRARRRQRGPRGLRGAERPCLHGDRRGADPARRAQARRGLDAVDPRLAHGRIPKRRRGS